VNKNHYNLNYFHTLWICAALVLAAIAVYYQVWTYDFVNYDDPEYVYENRHIQAGLTFSTVKWAFTTGYAANWLPLTWLSLMLDWQFFGSNAGGYHITNLVFHIANTLLLFIVLKQMTQTLWQSAFVAALFALHPLHVESVAWVSERKDVLSIFFWILTMWAYVSFVGRPKISRYLLVVVFFALGSMSKPMLVTLPFVLLLLDYWPLERLNTKRSLPHLLIEKIPLFAMVIASCIITFIVQKEGKAVANLAGFSPEALKICIYNAFISYIQYIIKMIWPARLAFFYPHPCRDVSGFFAGISAAVLLVATILILRACKKHRYLAVGWFWYLGTLVPVIGFVQVGSQAMADRYSYITLTGLFIIIAWGLPELLGKWLYRKISLWAFSLTVLSALAVLAHIQQRYWKNTITLCEHALKVTENNYEAHYCITDMLLEQGRIEEAIWHNTEALRIKPNYTNALNGLGSALMKAGKIDEAMGYYKKAIEISPRSAISYIHFGEVLAAKGKFDEALSMYQKALQLSPDVELYSNIGFVLAKSGKLEEAAKEYEKVLLIEPRNATAHKNLGAVFFQQKKFDQAAAEYRKALELKPGEPNILNALGNTLGRQGKLDEAVKYLNEAVRIKPDFAAAQANLGYALADEGKFDEAIVHFNQALQIEPNYTAVRNALEAATEKQKHK